MLVALLVSTLMFMPLAGADLQQVESGSQAILGSRAFGTVNEYAYGLGSGKYSLSITRDKNLLSIEGITSDNSIKQVGFIPLQAQSGLTTAVAVVEVDEFTSARVTLAIDEAQTQPTLVKCDKVLRGTRLCSRWVSSLEVVSTGDGVARFTVTSPGMYALGEPSRPGKPVLPSDFEQRLTARLPPDSLIVTDLQGKDKLQSRVRATVTDVWKDVDTGKSFVRAESTRGSVELEGVPSVATIDTLDITSDSQGYLSTAMAVVTGTNVTNATITLATDVPITEIVRCDVVTGGVCESGWVATNLSFTQANGVVTFSVTHFTGYGAVSNSPAILQLYLRSTANGAANDWRINLSTSQDGTLNRNNLSLAAGSYNRTYVTANLSAVAGRLVRTTDAVNLSMHWQAGTGVARTARMWFQLYAGAVNSTLICQNLSLADGATIGNGSNRSNATCYPTSDIYIAPGSNLSLVIGANFSTSGASASIRSLALEWDTGAQNSTLNIASSQMLDVNITANASFYRPGRSANVSGTAYWTNGSGAAYAVVNVSWYNASNQLTRSVNVTASAAGVWNDSYTFPLVGATEFWNVTVWAFNTTTVNATNSTTLLVGDNSVCINQTGVCWLTVQQAVDNATNGQTVVIVNATSVFNETVYFNRSINIILTSNTSVFPQLTAIGRSIPVVINVTNGTLNLSRLNISVSGPTAYGVIAQTYGPGYGASEVNISDLFLETHSDAVGIVSGSESDTYSYMRINRVNVSASLGGAAIYCLDGSFEDVRVVGSLNTTQYAIVTGMSSGSNIGFVNRAFVNVSGGGGIEGYSVTNSTVYSEWRAYNIVIGRNIFGQSNSSVTARLGSLGGAPSSIVNATLYGPSIALNVSSSSGSTATVENVTANASLEIAQTGNQGTVVLTNTSFTPANTAIFEYSTGNKTVRYQSFLSGVVYLANGSNVSGASVRVSNTTGAANHNLTTDSNGLFGPVVVTAATVFSNATVNNTWYQTNHTIYVNMSGYTNATQVVNLTESLLVNITLSTASNEINTCTPANGADLTISSSLTCNNTRINVTSLTITSGTFIVNASNLTVNRTEIAAGATFIARNTKNTIWQNGNLTINGTYVLDNSTLRMNGTTDGTIGITVNSGGLLLMDNISVITNGATPAFEYFFTSNGNVTVTNSTINATIGVTASNITLINSTINASGTALNTTVRAILRGVSLLSSNAQLNASNTILSLTDAIIGNYSFTGSINLTINSTAYGGINFTQNVSGRGDNLSRHIQFGLGQLYINESQTGLNVSANITLVGLTSNPQATILRNGVACSSYCTAQTALTGTTVVFNVSRAGNYSIATAPYLDSVTLNATDNPTNSSSANLTAYPIGAGNYTSLIYDWRVNGASTAVANMPFDTNSSSIVKDYSTFSNNGTISGPSWITAGVRGGAYSFDGLNDYVSVLYSASLGTSTTNNFTVMAWVNWRNSTYTKCGGNGEEYVVFKRKPETGVFEGYALAVAANASASFTMTSSGGVRGTLSSSVQIVPNTWAQLVGTHDGSNLRIYVNGVLAGTKSHPYTMYMGNRSLFIGRTGECGDPGEDTWDGYFNGSIDDVAIYNRTLSADQIYRMFLEANNSLNTSIVVASETTIGDNWSVVVTPNNASQGDGTSRTSNTVTILNSAPTQGTPTLTASDNPLNTTSATLTARNVSTADADGNSVTNTYAWRINGTPYARLLMPMLGGTSTQDYSGNGYNATVSGATYNATSGPRATGAYAFNETDSLSTNMTEAAGTQNWTISAWVKTVDASAGVVVHNRPSEFDQTVTLSVGHYADVLMGNGLPYVSLDMPGCEWGVQGNGSIANGSWNHLVGVRYFSSGVAYYKLYVNGVDDTGNNVTAGSGLCRDTSASSTQPWYIGGAHQWGSSTFDGNISGVQIYNRSLSSAQIAQLYQEGLRNGSNASIVPQELAVGQNWSVRVTPNDGTQDGIAQTSNGVEIRSGASVTCGVISSTTTLTENLSRNGSGACITITGDNILLDCAGYSISSNLSLDSYGILASGRNTTMRNCNVQNFYHPISLNNTNGTLIRNTSTYGYSGVQFSNSSNTVIANSTLRIQGGEYRALHEAYTYVYNLTVENSTLYSDANGLLLGWYGGDATRNHYQFRNVTMGNMGVYPPAWPKNMTFENSTLGGYAVRYFEEGTPYAESQCVSEYANASNVVLIVRRCSNMLVRNVTLASAAISNPILETNNVTLQNITINAGSIYDTGTDTVIRDSIVNPWYVAAAGTRLVVRNVSLGGHIQLEGANNVSVINSTSTGSYLFVKTWSSASGLVLAENTTISNTTLPIETYSANRPGTFLFRNVTLNRTALDSYTSTDPGFSVTLQEIIGVTVNDSNGALVQSANVSALNRTGGLVSSGLTSAAGTVNVNVTRHFRNNTDSWNETEFTFRASKSRYTNASNTTNITQSSIMRLMLQAINSVCVNETAVCFNSVQAAVDNATNGQIVVITDNETYNETVTFTKNISLTSNASTWPLITKQGADTLVANDAMVSVSRVRISSYGSGTSQNAVDGHINLTDVDIYVNMSGGGYTGGIMPLYATGAAGWIAYNRVNLTGSVYLSFTTYNQANVSLNNSRITGVGVGPRHITIIENTYVNTSSLGIDLTYAVLRNITAYAPSTTVNYAKNLTVYDSTFIGNGGDIMRGGENSTFYNTSFTNGRISTYFGGDNLTLINVTASSIDLGNSEATGERVVIINSSLTPATATAVAGTNITFKHFLHVTVTTGAGTSVDGAFVRVYNTSGALVANISTQPNGSIERANLTWAFESSSGVYYTENYTVNVTRRGSVLSNTTTVNMSGTQSVLLTLPNSVCINGTANCYATIQSALGNATTGQTIIITDAGTYNETLTITKNVTITSNGSGLPVLTGTGMFVTTSGGTYPQVIFSFVNLTGYGADTGMLNDQFASLTITDSVIGGIYTGNSQLMTPTQNLTFIRINSTISTGTGVFVNVCNAEANITVADARLNNSVQIRNCGTEPRNANITNVWMNTSGSTFGMAPSRTLIVENFTVIGAGPDMGTVLGRSISVTGLGSGLTLFLGNSTIIGYIASGYDYPLAVRNGNIGVVDAVIIGGASKLRFSYPSENTTLTVVNSSLSPSDAVANCDDPVVCTAYFQNWIDVNVTSGGSAVNGATVTFTNSSGSTYSINTTTSSGIARANLTWSTYVGNTSTSTTRYSSLYTVAVRASGYEGNSTTVNASANVFTNLTLMPLTVADTCTPDSRQNLDINGTVTCTNWVSAQNVTVRGNLTITGGNYTFKSLTILTGATIRVRNTKNTVWQNGNLTVNGTYSLDNATLRMNGTTTGDVNILVNSGGSFIAANNSLVDIGDAADFRYVLNSSGTVNATNSNITNGSIFNYGTVDFMNVTGSTNDTYLTVRSGSTATSLLRTRINTLDCNRGIDVQNSNGPVSVDSSEINSCITIWSYGVVGIRNSTLISSLYGFSEGISFWNNNTVIGSWTSQNEGSAVFENSTFVGTSAYYNSLVIKDAVTTATLRNLTFIKQSSTISLLLLPSSSLIARISNSSFTENLAGSNVIIYAFPTVNLGVYNSTFTLNGSSIFDAVSNRSANFSNITVLQRGASANIFNVSNSNNISLENWNVNVTGNASRGIVFKDTTNSLILNLTYVSNGTTRQVFLLNGTRNITINRVTAGGVGSRLAGKFILLENSPNYTYVWNLTHNMTQQGLHAPENDLFFLNVQDSTFDTNNAAAFDMRIVNNFTFARSQIETNAGVNTLSLSWGGSNISITDSQIAERGGAGSVFIGAFGGFNVVVNRTNLTAGSFSFQGSTFDAIIENSRILNIYLNGWGEQNVTVLNSTFTGISQTVCDGTPDCNVKVQWFTTVKTTNRTGAVQAGATVNATLSNGTTMFSSVTTNGLGLTTPQIMTQYIWRNGVNTSYQPAVFRATMTGMANATKSISITNNSQVNMTVAEATVCVNETGRCFGTVQEAIDNATAGQTVIITDSSEYIEQIYYGTSFLRLTSNGTVRPRINGTTGYAFYGAINPSSIDIQGVDFATDSGASALYLQPTIMNITDSQITGGNIAAHVFYGPARFLRINISMAGGQSPIQCYQTNSTTVIDQLRYDTTNGIPNYPLTCVYATVRNSQLNSSYYGLDSGTYTNVSVNSERFAVYVLDGENISITNSTLIGRDSSEPVVWVNNRNDVNVSLSISNSTIRSLGGGPALGTYYYLPGSYSQNVSINWTNVDFNGSIAITGGSPARISVNLLNTSDANVTFTGFNGTAYANVSFANYLDVRVNSTTGINLSSATVNGYTNVGETVFTSVTNSTGQISRQTVVYKWNFSNATQNTSTYLTNHTVAANISGYINANKSVNLSSYNNMFVTLTSSVGTVCVQQTGNCFTTIQGAVDNATNGQTVIITDGGTYYENITLPRNINLTSNSTIVPIIVAGNNTAITISNDVWASISRINLSVNSTITNAAGIYLYRGDLNVSEVSCTIFAPNDGGCIYTVFAAVTARNISVTGFNGRANVTYGILVFDMPTSYFSNLLINVTGHGVWTNWQAGIIENSTIDTNYGSSAVRMGPNSRIANIRSYQGGVSVAADGYMENVTNTGTFNAIELGDRSRAVNVNANSDNICYSGGSNATIVNSTFSGVCIPLRWDIGSRNGTLHIINSTMTPTDTSLVFGQTNTNFTVFFQRYLDVNVTSPSGSPLASASVTIRNSSGAVVQSTTTQLTGISPRQNITYGRAYWNGTSGSTSYETNHTINVSRGGPSNSTSVNMSVSRVVALTLPHPVCVNETGNCFATIQAAVDNATNGQTVIITDGGTYAENVTIAGKNLTVTSNSSYPPTVTSDRNATFRVGVTSNDVNSWADVNISYIIINNTGNTTVGRSIFGGSGTLIMRHVAVNAIGGANTFFTAGHTLTQLDYVNYTYWSADQGLWSGNTIITNSRLINAAPVGGSGGYTIYNQGGPLTMNSSYVGGDYPVYLRIATLHNVTLNGTGGNVLQGPSNISNTSIKSGGSGITIGNNIAITDSRIESDYVGVLTWGGGEGFRAVNLTVASGSTLMNLNEGGSNISMTLLNTSIGPENVSSGLGIGYRANITFQRFIEVTVTNPAGMPLASTTVTVKNTTNASIANATTIANGSIARQNITWYSLNWNGSVMSNWTQTNHTINVTRGGPSNSTSVNMSVSRVVSLTLPNPVCVNETGNCFATIQAAVDNATNGQTVVITDGAVYYESVRLNKSVILTSNSTTHPTISASGIVLNGTGQSINVSKLSIEGTGTAGQSVIRADNVDLADIALNMSTNSSALNGIAIDAYSGYSYVRRVNISAVNSTSALSTGTHPIVLSNIRVLGTYTNYIAYFSYSAINMSNSFFNVSMQTGIGLNVLFPGYNSELRNVTVYLNANGGPDHILRGDTRFEITVYDSLWNSTGSLMTFAPPQLTFRNCVLESTTAAIQHAYSGAGENVTLIDTRVRAPALLSFVIGNAQANGVFRFINVTADSNRVDVGSGFNVSAVNVTFENYLNVNVTTSIGLPLSSSSVTVTNVSGGTVATTTTNASGDATRQTLVWYTQQWNGTSLINNSHTNHTVNVSRGGPSNSTSVNMSVSRVVSLTLPNPVCVNETGNCFATIQEAVNNATNGQTVIITDNGTYTESVSVNKSLSITSNSTVWPTVQAANNTSFTVNSSYFALSRLNLVVLYNGTNAASVYTENAGVVLTDLSINSNITAIVVGISAGDMNVSRVNYTVRGEAYAFYLPYLRNTVINNTQFYGTSAESYAAVYHSYADFIRIENTVAYSNSTRFILYDNVQMRNVTVIGGYISCRSNCLLNNISITNSTTGVILGGTNATLRNSVLTNGYYGVSFISGIGESDDTVENVVVTGFTQPARFYTDDGSTNVTVRLVNTSFEPGDITFNYVGADDLIAVAYERYLDVYVNTSGGSPVSGATVSVTNVTGATVYSGISAGNGSITRQNVTWYTQYWNGSVVQNRTQTNHTVSATKAFLGSANTTANMSISRSITLTLANTAPSAPTLTRPLNNNYTVTERYPTFNWTTSTDGEGDAITYQWNITPASGCAAIPLKNTSSIFYTSTDKLCVDRVYNWSVRACDNNSACSVYATQFNFTIASVVGVTFTNGSVSFGSLIPSLPDQNTTNNTLTNSPSPLRYNNTGNVDIITTMRANAALWTAQALSTNYFQYADENSSSWNNITSGYTALTANLTTSAIRELELNIWVPQGEPGGAKNTTITVLGASIE